ncbi:MAG: DUF4129 domain-containing protein [Ornithinibacter sp.]
MASSRSLVATASARPVVACLGAAAIVLTIWAAAVPRPDGVIRLPDAQDRARNPPPVDEQIQRGVDLALPPTTGSGRPTSDLVAGIVGWSTVLVLVLVAVAAGLLVLRAAIAAWRNRRVAPDADADLAPDLQAIALAVSGGTDDRLDALAAGSPAEGIIRAWSLLEATLAGAGVPLVASRTSTEVTLDVLHRFAVDQEALGDLAALYREARYSRHDLTEADRARAEAAHQSLDADLRSLTPGARQARRG